MSRGGRGGYSPRGSSYRGSSSRGNSWHEGRGGYPPRGRGSSNRFSSFDSRSRYSGSSDRMSNSRHEEYRKPSYRPDSNYGRDLSGHRSPDRKRLRTEASSSRHDSYGSGGSGSGYGSSSRYESAPYSERSRGFSDRHVGSHTSMRRDEFRRPAAQAPPPPLRGGGSYRGRVSSRGVSRGLRARDRPTRRRLAESSYAVRKRAVMPRSTGYTRKLMISKMRSMIARRARKRSTSEKGESDEEKEEKVSKPPKEIEIKQEEPEEMQVKQEKPPAPKEKVVNEKEDKPESPEEDASLTRPKKTFIKLVCPHCNVKVPTFRKYDIHLSSKTHLMAMRKIAIKQKSILAQMRAAQRNTQNELEKNNDNLTPRTNFCPLCKLNYKQRKAIHQRTEAHKNMKKFLMPFCKVCNITFNSPMIYENHCCSIEHIKRKQRVDNGNSDGSVEEDNLEDFTTIDSVGDVDGNAASSDIDDKKEDGQEPVNVGIEQIRKVEAYYCDLCKMYLSRGEEQEMPRVLARHCKQRVHLQRYVRYKEDKDLEKRAEKLQRKETAEKETKIKKVKEELETSVVETDPSGAEKEADKVVDEEEARDDKLWSEVDKDLGDILAEAESVNNCSDEDEEDDSHMNGERYDRFKLSEKNGEEVLNETEGDAEVVSVKEEKAEDVKEVK